MDNEENQEMVSNIVENVMEEKNRPSWNKIVVPLQMLVIFFLVCAIGLMIYEFKGIELIVIVVLMFALFTTTTLLILTGTLGLQLALLRIPSMKKYAGDQWEIRLEDSGQAPIRITRFKDFIRFSDGQDSAKVRHAFFYEPNTGLPVQIGVQGFPLTVDPREQYSKEPFEKIKNQLRALSSVMISIFHLGRHKGQQDLNKMMKYIMYTFYGIIILAVLILAVLYFNVQLNAFFEEHGKNIVDTINAAQEASKQITEYIASTGATNLIPQG